MIKVGRGEEGAEKVVCSFVRRSKKEMVKPTFGGVPTFLCLFLRGKKPNEWMNEWMNEAGAAASTQSNIQNLASV